MSYFKKAVFFLAALIICVSLVSCDSSSSNVYSNSDFSSYNIKDGELCTNTRLAYYNNGNKISELEDLDKEIFNEAPLNDGSFTIYFAVTNNTKFDKKITSVIVDFIRNSSNQDIVKPTTFDIDYDFYIASGETKFIPCIFEKDFVLLEAKLDNLSTKVGVAFEGCVTNGADPEKQSKGISSSIKELKFTSTNGIEGTFALRNNNSTTVKIGKISFMLYTDKNEQITKKPVEMNIDMEIKSEEVLTLKYAIMPNNVSEKITENKLFDGVVIKVTEE